jgi:hypothetical protein
MRLKDTITKDISSIMGANGFAEPITYNGVAMVAIPEIAEDNGKGNTFSSNGRAAEAFFWIAEADVSWPEPGTVIVYGSNEWTVSRLVCSAGGLHKVAVTGRESVY